MLLNTASSGGANNAEPAESHRVEIDPVVATDDGAKVGHLTECLFEHAGGANEPCTRVLRTSPGNRRFTLRLTSPRTEALNGKGLRRRSNGRPGTFRALVERRHDRGDTFKQRNVQRSTMAAEGEIIFNHDPSEVDANHCRIRRMMLDLLE